MKKELPNKQYDIKIPVYVTGSVVENKGLFNLTYSDLVQIAKSKIDSFNSSGDRLTSNKRNKPTRKEIQSITYKEKLIGDIPVLLIQMDASTTNNFDIYVESDERILIKPKDKIGSGNHWILMYPRIVGLDPSSYSCFWYVFVYADPTKIFDDVTNSAKIFIRKVIGLKLRNIKSAEMLKELGRQSSIPELQVRYLSLTNDRNDSDIMFNEYRTKGSLKHEREDFYENLPFESAEELINNTDYLKSFQQKFIKIISGKKEFKIEKRALIDESSNLLDDYIEESFNMSSPINETELSEDILYNEEFMMSKLIPVIQNYISSYAD